MAENDNYEEEYKFDDVDPLTPNAPENEAPPSFGDTAKSSSMLDFLRGNLQRNIIIGVSLLLVAFVLYKFLDAMFTTRKSVVAKKSVKTVATKPVKPQVSKPKVSIAPIQQKEPEPEAAPPLKQKLAALEVSQKSVRQEVASVSNEINGISTNVQGLAEQIDKLNTLISRLDDKIAAQAHDIDILMSRTRPKKKQHVHKTKPKTKPTVYHVQALIPGRAWLIAENGTTITVSSGSTIPGYGKVRLIDPQQGQVMTSSGRIIRFSSTDS